MERDTLNNENPLRGMVAALRAARRPPPEPAVRRTSGRASNGLVEVLQNANFFPREPRDDGAASNADNDSYDDLTPLEYAGPSTSHTSRATRRPRSPADATVGSSDSEDVLPALEPSSRPSSPRLSARDVHLPTPRVATNSIPASSTSVGEAVHEDAVAASSNAPGSPVASRRSRTSPRRSRVPQSSHAASMPEDNEAGVESDSSMPTLRTVSDSSDDEEDSVNFESEWEDTDDFYTDDDFEDDDAHSAGLPPIPPSNHSREPNARRPALFDFFPDFTTEMTGNRDELFQSFREMLERASSVPNIGQLRPFDDSDPTRAETILTGLEKISVDLVRRYEKLHGQDGDGCAICRDDLCDDPSLQDVVSVYAALPFHPEANDVIAFPCVGKHLFHGDCISQWLARKTTCPSCRFDIDPHSLTHKRNREGPNAGLDSQGRLTRVWQPPQVESMAEWLDAEERARASGVPRERPQPIMQTPGPLPGGPNPAAAAASLNASFAAAFGPNLTLADLLDSPAPDWHYDPASGTIDVLAAFRSMSQMRQAYLEADADERMRLVSLFHREEDPVAESRQPWAEVPARPPSAPPVAPSAASPSTLPPSGPPPAAPSGTAPQPARPRTLAQQFEQAIIGNTEVPTSVRIPPDIAQEVSRRVAAGERQVVIQMPPENREPGLFELLTHFNNQLREMHQNNPPSAHDAAFPMSFEDVAGEFAPATAETQLAQDTVHLEVDANAFDEAEVPPPIVADPNQALHAEAPLSVEAEFMHALLSAGVVTGSDSEVSAPSGDDWLDRID